MNQTDIIIVGGGIAGLTAAYFLSEKFQVTILDSGDGVLKTSSTQMAQGGMAASKNWQLHFEDTMKAGNYKNNDQVVKQFTQRAWEAYEWLKNDIGVPFHKDPVLEGAHSEKCIWTTGDDTGFQIYTALLGKCKQKKNISWIHKARANSLLKNSVGDICGVQYNTQGLELRTDNLDIKVRYAVILATGGIGGLFQYSTNPQTLRGDALLLAHDAGAELENLDYIQFHPTGLKSKDKPVFLLTESLRGEGAVLRNKKGERFLSSLPMQDLSARNIIVAEMQKQKEVFLDLCGKKKSFWEQGFPHISQKLKREGYNIEKDLIPVTAVQHFLCGGIQTNIYSQTTLSKLYALGECASTGVHGINRLASNSLTEAVVFAFQMIEVISSGALKSSCDKVYSCSHEIDFAQAEDMEKIRECMQRFVRLNHIEKESLHECLSILPESFEKRTALLFTK